MKIVGLITEYNHFTMDISTISNRQNVQPVPTLSSLL